ncbi:YfjI family protein [Sorangium sp. So ce321]|uniref:YfjI family protein n=1 Tax=Sorangium sp. So ce321 TaxID=3133300 RepID=UPI003F609B5E
MSIEPSATAAVPYPSSQAVGSASAARADELALLACLALAQADGLEPNVRRFLDFLGHANGDVIELIEFDVPMQYRGRRALFARTRLAETAVNLLVKAESEQGHGQGLYVLLNKAHAAVVQRSETDAWAIAEKGDTCTDSDIVARRSLYIDIDITRPAGVSATDDEVNMALGVAGRVYAELAGILRSDGALGLGHSGNGAAVFAALADLEETSELKSLVKGILAAVGQLYGDGVIKIDGAVADAKRFVPAFGTIKRKGAPNVPDRPHRRTAFVCAEVVQRLGIADLEAIFHGLTARLTTDQLAEVSKARGNKPAVHAVQRTDRGRSKPAGERADTVYSRANNLDVHEVLARLDLIDGEYPRCPGCGVSGDSSVAVVGNGLKCLHASCASKGRDGFRTNVDLVVEVTGEAPLDAALTLLGWFDVEAPRCGKTAHSANSANSASHPPSPESQPWPDLIPLRCHPALPPFPVDALPGWLREWASAEAVATQTPIDMPAAMALACLSVAVGKKFKVSVNPSWHEPTNLYLVTALEPGNRKSAVVGDAVKPVHERERALVDHVRAESLKVRAKLALLDKTEKKAISDAVASGKSDEIEQLLSEREKTKAPIVPRLLGDDATPEKLGVIMAEQGGQLGILSAEGDVFDIMSGRYSGDGAPNLGIFLKAHAGDDFRVDRIHREPILISAPCLTLGLTVQPAVLTSLLNTPSFRERGLLARILFALPESRLGFRNVDPPPMPVAIAHAYRKRMLELMQLPERRDERGEIVPTQLALSPEGSARRVEFAAAIEPRLGVHGDLYPLRDCGGKLVGAVIRIAALLHLAEHGNSGPPISAFTLEKAIEIGSYYIEHAREAFALMGADRRIDDAAYVSGNIIRKGWTSFTKRELFEVVKGRIKKAAHLDEVLSLLADHGQIRRQPDPPHPGPGRKPSTRYEVSPYLLAHNSHNPQNGAQPPSYGDAPSSRPSHYSQNSQNSALPEIDHDDDESVTERAGTFDLPAATGMPGRLPKRPLTPEELENLNAAIDERFVKRELRSAQQTEKRAAEEAALCRDRKRVEADLRETREQMALYATTIERELDQPREAGARCDAALATKIETINTVAARPGREPSRNTFADAVRIANETGGISLSEVMARVSATRDGSLTSSSSRRTDHGSLPADRTVAAPNSAPPNAPASPEVDEWASEVLRKCADAAMKVHGVGPYAPKT